MGSVHTKAAPGPGRPAPLQLSAWHFICSVAGDKPLSAPGNIHSSGEVSFYLINRPLQLPFRGAKMEVGFDLGSPSSPHTGPLGGDGHSGWGGAPQ